MPSMSKFFKRDREPKLKNPTTTNGAPKLEVPRKRWDDAWQRTSVDPEEVQELLHECTKEIKARAMELPFPILPFRPASDPSAAKTFIRNFFGDGQDPSGQPRGSRLTQELRMVEPLVLCSVVKWCWSRLPGGVVTWEAYELFNIGEKDSKQAQDAFNTFIPLSVGSPAREKIIYDFFELLAAMAAHGKTNGLSGRKLSRYAGWWAFDHTETTKGFEGGYKNWEKAADAASHLFFAYLRSLTTAAPTTQERSGVNLLPRALETLLDTTEYPPEPQVKLQTRASKVVMIVESVSPTPFALLRRAGHFQYREEDQVLQRFSDFEEPMDALTDECRRVLRSISATNDSSSAKTSTSLKDPSWSRFQDMGFGNLSEESDSEQPAELNKPAAQTQRLRSAPQNTPRGGPRPMTPSWGDFLSTGFSENQSATTLLPPDRQLPPIIGSPRERAATSPSHRMSEDSSLQDRGELANIVRIEFDSAFWWTWMTSLASEEPPQRKAAFGRCALIETRIYGGCWLLMEEIIKGAPEPSRGAYVAEKKSKFSFRGLTRSRSSAKGTAMLKGQGVSRGAPPPEEKVPTRPTLDKEQHARIQAAAAALQRKHSKGEPTFSTGRSEENSQKTQSTMTLQSSMIKDATPALQWARSYDKQAMRQKYLGDEFAGTGSNMDLKEVLGAGGLASVPEVGQKPPTPPKDTAQPQRSGSREGLSPRDSSLRATPSPAGEEPPPSAPAKDMYQPPTPQKDVTKPVTPPKDTAQPQATTFFQTHTPPEEQPVPIRGAAEVAVSQVPPNPQTPPKAKAFEPISSQEKLARAQEASPKSKQAARKESPSKKETKSKASSVLRPGAGRKARRHADLLAEEEPEPTSIPAPIASPPAPERAAPPPPPQPAPERAAPPPPPPAQEEQSKLVPKDEPAPQTAPAPPIEPAKPAPLPKDEPVPPSKIEQPTETKKAEAQPTNKLTKTASRTEEPAKVSESSEAPDTPAKSSQTSTETPSTGETSADSKGDRHRLQKKEKGGRIGIKAMFGRKKGEEEKKPADKPPAKPAPSSSVAAARAALEAKAKESQAPAPSPQNRVTAKRVSTFGTKEIADDKATSSSPGRDGAATPTASKGATDRPISTAASSVVDPVEEQRAHEAFSTFDQGLTEGHQSSGAPSPKMETIEQVTPRPMPAKPVEQQAQKVEEPPVAGADATTEELKKSDSHPNVEASDRWAQIRKNAAERAARMSEDHSGPTDKTDEDDETDDGEESIESRVARIKARVAELTGNIEPAKNA